MHIEITLGVSVGNGFHSLVVRKPGLRNHVAFIVVDVFYLVFLKYLQSSCWRSL